MELDIQVIQTQHPKQKPEDESSLGFGRLFTDHMFLVEYTEGRGWHDARIQPYGPLSIDPASPVLHYSQEIFEGLKVYRRADGGLQMFRPMENANRMNQSADRMCMPPLDPEFQVRAMKTLVELERDGSVTELLPNMAAVYADQWATYAIDRQGTLWGRTGESGCLLPGAYHGTYVPDFVPLMEGVASVAQYSETFVMVKRDGTLWAWGDHLGGVELAGAGADCGRGAVCRLRGLPRRLVCEAGPHPSGSGSRSSGSPAPVTSPSGSSWRACWMPAMGQGAASWCRRRTALSGGT